VVGAREVALDVAEVEPALEHDVAVEGVVDPGRLGVHRRDGVDDRRQHLVVDVDQGARVLGDVPARRRHRGHRLAGEADALDRDRVLGHGLGAEGRHRLDELRGLGAGQHGHDARQRLRPRRVDRADARVGVRAAQDRRVEHAGHRHVADEGRAAGQQLRVLLARDAAPDPAEVLERRRVGTAHGLLDGAHAATPSAGAGGAVGVPWLAARSGPAAHTALTMF
jgi:hypothetical protein